MASSLYLKYPNDNFWYICHCTQSPKDGVIPFYSVFGLTLTDTAMANYILFENNDGSFTTYKDRDMSLPSMKDADFIWMKLGARPLANR